MSEDRLPCDPYTLISRAAAAKLLCVHPKTLARWAKKGEGPCWLKVGARIVYRVSDIREWIDSAVGDLTTLGAKAQGPTLTTDEDTASS